MSCVHVMCKLCVNYVNIQEICVNYVNIMLCVNCVNIPKIRHVCMLCVDVYIQSTFHVCMLCVTCCVCISSGDEPSTHYIHTHTHNTTTHIHTKFVIANGYVDIP